MSKKVLVVKSSPRLQGNSATLADRAAAGARAAGAQVDVVELQRLNIQPCDGCDACKESGRCVIGDDMQLLYAKVLDADAFILASPIYWFTFTAQMKLFIDRCYAAWNHNNIVFKGKPFGIILTYGDSDLFDSGGINAIHTFESMFRFTGAVAAGYVHASLSDVGDAQKHPELLERAYRLGERIGTSSP
jgi:multimeric flavodoxin WrbA